MPQISTRYLDNLVTGKTYWPARNGEIKSRPAGFLEGSAFSSWYDKSRDPSVVGEAGNLFVAIENDPDPIAGGALFQKRTYAAGAPQRNHIRLGHQQHRIRMVAQQPCCLVHAARAVHHDIAEVGHQ